MPGSRRAPTLASDERKVLPGLTMWQTSLASAEAAGRPPLHYDPWMKQINRKFRGFQGVATAPLSAGQRRMP